MASDNDSDNSGGTIAMEDDSFFNSVLGPDELNLSLYQFDEKKNSMKTIIIHREPSYCSLREQ